MPHDKEQRGHPAIRLQPLLPEFTPAVDEASRATLLEALFAPEFQERFWARVARASEECWAWQGTVTTGGYGQVWVSRDHAHVAVHRASWLLAGHDIPEGFVLDHLCRNRRCVNPAHLEPVTNRENILRGEGAAARAARTGFCARGHWYGGENLRLRANGSRVCRACERGRARRRGRG